jgi:hypothetical protein
VVVFDKVVSTTVISGACVVSVSANVSFVSIDRLQALAVINKMDDRNKRVIKITCIFLFINFYLEIKDFTKL